MTSNYFTINLKSSVFLCNQKSVANYLKTKGKVKNYGSVYMNLLVDKCNILLNY